MEKDGVVLVPIPELDYDSNYLADVKNGRIWSKKSNRWLLEGYKGENDSFGYAYTSIKGKPYSIHSLIMSAHLGVKKDYWIKKLGLEINHIDGNKKNNAISNLELKSRKDQYDERVRKKLGKGQRLKPEEIFEILEQYQEFKDEDDFKLSKFCRMMAEAYEKHYNTIAALLKGKSYQKLTGGII